ncbi:hypothetical protein [Pseudomonas aeruginosa]|uniref:hypothetical protein n=1 Tax=Pseudomonas aeruginosa TaxID=287 RepID=UPI0003D5A2AF|nr:hypothetical protein [Pseudomonas aeruginosa]AHC66030.1 hypothetical protein T223_17290 [Pseudomonas aeruginosa LES431]AHK84256.1 hypothetical protein T227_17230 [Pseudomonas aeruginosa LESlike5]AHK90159.1 hypothetical protein T228_16920 [Pseudomonas aeruginosa LESlike7]AHK96139.1 hypothetical protein T222_17625 [Pseudomonas aeruginosa LES400]AHL02101.1 hypothetical protein T224_17215 [Pseudomonas aeruginosa LESB65]
MEDEAFSIWTPHQAFYIQSMLFNTASAFQSCNIAEKIIQKISDGEIDPQEKKDILLDCLQNVVNQSGAISRYFFPSRDGVKGTDKKTIHRDRGQYLSKVFGVKDDSPLMNRALRNSIEHFDERLDLYLQDGIVGYIFPSLILPEPEDSDMPHHIFRAYYLKEGIFQVLGERYEIQPIVDEMARIHDLLVKFDGNGGVFRS